MAKYLVLVTFHKERGQRAEHQNRGNQSKTWVQQQVSGGTVESAYAFTTADSHQGGCAIVEANSVGDVNNLLRNNPATPSVSYEIHELVDYGAGVDQLLAMQ